MESRTEEGVCAKAPGHDYCPPQLLCSCPSVSCNTQMVTLPSLHWGSFELWVTVSTIAGQGPPGPSLWLHLPGMRWGWGCLPTPGWGCLEVLMWVSVVESLLMERMCIG